ncbi:carbohydrate ABC transporter permease [Arcanobacterium phocae]|uniref:Carbohydrate ABC transporter membrane protein 2, CUT1 family n=1 Tax=Arcanobacterium phocae TaxID=131112 RepID=A0A1H2LDP0_9ACTO|nr:carbohydrate ABC transporter permease [Arcanobacterium phocae]SDU79127.1 carbohydrate ABC transporter membrane protein 2, CUT1 family [Arcanobacterium phocae]
MKKFQKKLGNTSSVVGIIAIVVFCLAPFYWMFVSSIRPATKIFETSLWPSEVSFENYGAVFDPSRGFGRALINSVIVAGTTTILALLVATFAAYALARLEFRGKTFILTVIVATSMFPIVAIVVPLLQLFTGIGWINTYQSMILPSLSFALPLAVWNLHSFFRQMPRELEQAAMIDGCTPGQAFRKIIMPLAAPGVFTTAIIVFINAWNEFMIAVTMVNDQAMQTAPVAISKFGGVSQFETPYGSQMAAGIVVTIPLVILVLVFQRRIVAGLAAGGVKS